MARSFHPSTEGTCDGRAIGVTRCGADIPGTWPRVTAHPRGTVRKPGALWPRILCAPPGPAHHVRHRAILLRCGVAPTRSRGPRSDARCAARSSATATRPSARSASGACASPTSPATATSCRRATSAASPTGSGQPEPASAPARAAPPPPGARRPPPARSDPVGRAPPTAPARPRSRSPSVRRVPSPSSTGRSGRGPASRATR